MNILFSDLLTSEQLKQVNYYTYFPIRESRVEGQKTYQLLPSDHAIYYPLDFSITPHSVIKGELNFFNKVIFQNLSPGNYIPEEKINFSQTNSKKHEKCLIVNLLDNCFGHSFMKLLNLKDIYEERKNEYDIYIIVPRALEHFLPTGIFNVISLNIGFAEAEKAYNLGHILDDFRKKYQLVDFAVVDTYKEYNSKSELIDFFRFTDKDYDSSFSKKVITFYYRSDFYRTWGGRHQAKNITSFLRVLKNYFSGQVSFYVVGDKDRAVFPDWIEDKRVNKFTAQVDFEYNTIFKNSLMTVGIMGSNMLAPSLFSEMSVHLIPAHKLGNTAEEIINSSGYAIPACFENIHMYGDGLMTEYPPEMLANRLVILYYTKLAKGYKKACMELLKEQKEVVSQKDYFLKSHSYFNYPQAMVLKSNIQSNAYNQIRRQYVIKKILDKFSSVFTFF